MSSFNIHQEDIESLFSFSQLPEEVQDDTYKLLEEIKLGDHPKKLSKIISEKYDVDYNDIFDALNFYFNLVKTIHRSKMDDNEIHSEIISIIENDFDFDEEDFKKIESSVKSFIRIKNDIPLITSLAFDMAISTNSLFLKSFIYEDLRPVFFNDEVSGLALFHTMRLHFRKEDRSHTDLYLTIDSEDIDDLIGLLTLAKNRAAVLREKYGESIIEI